MSRPERIILVRHGESMGNVDEDVYTHTPDWRIPLSPSGFVQSRNLGKRLKETVGDHPCFFYISPYTRTIQTYQEIVSQLPKEQVIGCQEDPRAVEQQFGNFQDRQEILKCKEERKKFGRFFYRFKDGESGLDVYARCVSLITSMFRDINYMREEGTTADNLNVVLVTHGLTLRTFLMRWFNLTVEEFDQTYNPPNASMIVLNRVCDPRTGRQWYQMGPQAWELLRVPDPGKFVVVPPGGAPRKVFEETSGSTTSAGASLDVGPAASFAVEDYKRST